LRNLVAMSLLPAAAVALILAAGPTLAGPFSHMFSKSAKEQRAASGDHADAIADQVREALDERRFVDAGDILEKARLDGVKSPRLTTLGGEALLAQGRFADAAPVFRSVESDPSVRPMALEGEGIALSEMGKSDQAFADLKQATALDKTRWRAWNALAREYDIRHDWKESKAAYVQALAAPGAEQAIVLNNRGYSHLLQNLPEQATPDFVAALAKDPDLKAARTNLRIAMAVQGQYDRAVTTGAGDDRAAVLNNVGLAAAIRGDYREAERLLTQAIEIKGDNYERAADNLQLAKNLEARMATQSTSAVTTLNDHP
jgi:Flp pilus assembly protein TadD